jgi:signal transduction histidine kinase
MWQAAIVLVAGAYAALTIAAPAWQVAVHSPDLRVLLEVAGFCMVAFAAVILSLPAESDVRPARNAFVAALATIAVTNAVFTLWPVAAGERLAVDRGVAYYPWLAGRYVAGAWFVAAGLDRPRAPLRRVLLGALAALVVVQATLAVVGPAISVPFGIDPTSGRPVVVAPGVHAVLQLVPAALFGVGAVLAARLHARTAAPAHRWLSLALTLQVFAQLHEVRFPAALGPLVTSADVHRAAAFLCLVAGAVLQLRWAYRSRSRAVRVQQGDLEASQQLVDELRAFAEQEQAFRTIVSHELETPLATLRAYAHVLQGADDDLPQAQRRAVAGIEAETRRLSELVGRLEELRELESSRFTSRPRPTRLRPLLDDAAAFVAGLPGGHPVTVRSLDVRVHADPVLVGQALRNLLTNATRYSPAETPVELEAGPAEHADRIAVRVIDRGPGIPADERDRVRRRYVRGSTAVGTEGSGLGLYVATRIAEAHGGELRLGPRPGGGTTAEFTLEVLS